MEVIIQNQPSMTAALADLSDDQRKNLADQMLLVAARQACLRRPLAWESMSVIYAVDEQWHADYLAMDGDVDVVATTEELRAALVEGAEQILIPAESGITLALVKYVLSSHTDITTIYWQDSHAV